MINEKFIEKIEQMTMPETVMTEKAGQFIRSGAFEFKRVMADNFPTVECRTLTGLLDYIRENPDGIDFHEDGVFLHVEGPDLVSLNEGRWLESGRDTYLRAKSNRCRFGFDSYHDQESFIVMLQANFVRTETLEMLLQAVSTMKHEKINVSKDDNMSQEIQTRQGISRVTEVAIENPVTLAPFSTFAEIPQPDRDFILRFRGGSNGTSIEIALFEVDGRTWEDGAMSKIKEYLTSRIGDTDLSIPVIA